MNRKDIGVTILMPCLNESKTLPICIQKSKKFLMDNHIKGEVLIADNGSTDNSIAVAEGEGARVVRVSEKGYGSALLGGIHDAKYEFVIMGDADDSYDFSALSPFIEKFQEGYDLVMGNRFKGGIRPGAMSFSHKYIGNPILSGIGRIFYKSDIGDFHCGLRGFRRDSILSLGLCTTGMEFASEMVVKAVLFGLKIVEVPTILYPDGRDRPPHLRSFRDGWRHLKFLLLYSPNWLFFYPGLLLFIAGVVFMLAISINPIYIGSISFEVTTMFYCSTFTLLGFSSIMFSIYSNMYASKIGQLPPNSKVEHLIQKITCDYGIFFGLFITVVGILGVITTMVLWAKIDFGHLTNTFVYKIAIVSGTLFALGVQLMFSSFFIGILQLDKVERVGKKENAN